ncbi:AbrB/MazE/SpoVT family DNA-binding domain-containing protein [Rickettsiales endosymbiont of Stachyamoeba lipophora]|uniref:AbrB/MazE/SpoVT family DNA-binding domain-containing protein n=1 Tax=Rickettsiales endosymbiont of Stachyamoeba lipophora TaxID=2486578 RepID=UPI000F65013D|nr:AbrB/MazE/SpoVT family DNA-binding domain-containing protein [Rickettsiales endosymbiont of Stachyamoeba lipophora]AZL16087.1 AbrB/MazE/SpoVT family DNA-binding domain-containing protein [Rickettsiales endosymbiont of Stachyamoeba lipophora]
MQVNIIKIGNSQGIRIPKSLLERFNGAQSFEIVESDNQIVLKPITAVRKSWEKSFKNEQVDNEFRDLDIHNSFDQEEWEW